MAHTPAITYQSASYSHVGMVRQINEDAFRELPGAGLWVVADGMGGHAAGDYVSSLIVDTLRRIPPSDALSVYTSALRSRLAEVNAAVREETAHRGVAMMGSTVVLLPRWDREVAAQCVQRYRITGWTAVPTLIQDFFANGM